MTDQRLTLFVKAAELTQRAATAPVLARHGLTYAQLAMLLSIARAPGVSGAALARMHGITPQSAGEVIGSLLRRDLLARASDPAHRKTLILNPTAAGRALVAEIQPALDAIDRALTAGVSPEDLAVTRRVLAAIIANGDTISGALPAA